MADSDDEDITPQTFGEDTSRHSVKKEPNVSPEKASSNSNSTRRSTRQSTRVSTGDFEVATTRETSQESWEDAKSPEKEDRIATSIADGPAMELGATSNTDKDKLRILEAPTTEGHTEEELLMLGAVATSSNLYSSMLNTATAVGVAAQPTKTEATKSTINTNRTTDGTKTHGATNTDVTKANGSPKTAEWPTKNATDVKATGTKSVTGVNGTEGKGAANISSTDAIDTSNSTINYFARVQTDSRLFEIPVPSEYLVDVDKLTGSIHRFLAWKNGEGKDVPITFDQFHSIFSLDRSSNS